MPDPQGPFMWAGEGRAGQSPLVFDSPHSWRDWPRDATVPGAPKAALDTGWDAWVDELWARAAQGTCPVLAARFHRACIDANRARDDIDPQVIDSAWPGPTHPSAACRRGMGLIRRLALPGVPVYPQPLSVQEVQARIDGFYDPYHAALADLIDQTHAAFGLVCHIDGHSMKSVGNAMNVDGGQSRPDMVVSNRAGETSDPFLLRWIATSLRALGYQVQINHPYQGAELIRRHSDPARQRHSVQIEINRALYMDEQRFERHEGFDRLAAHLGIFVAQLDEGLRSALWPARPELQ